MQDSNNTTNSNFTHLSDSGEANMVDVSNKPDTARVALAQSRIVLSESILKKVRDQSIAKGDLLATARIAGIQAAKKCSDLIPLCHPLPLTKISIDIDEFVEKEKVGLAIIATCKTNGKTGVEMEALTASAIAALTIYDMCKALDKGLVIESVQLLEKQGGKSGHWLRQSIDAESSK